MPESDSVDLDDLICDFQSLLTAIAGAIESAAAVHHAAEKSCFVFDSVILDWTDEECLSEDRLFLATRPTDIGADGWLVLTRDEWRADTIRRLTEHGIRDDWTSDAAMVKTMRATGEFLNPHPPLRSKQPYRTLPEPIVDACERLSLLAAASARVEQTLTKLDHSSLELLDAFVMPRRWRPDVLSALDCLDTWPTGKLTPSHLICEDYTEFSCPERMIDFVSRVLRASPIPAWTKIFDATSEWCGQCQSLRLEVCRDHPSETLLSPLQLDVLRTLFQRSAFDSDHLLPTEEVALFIEGGDFEINKFKEPVARLKVSGLLGTKVGRGGGIWLTDAGKERAAKL